VLARAVSQALAEQASAEELSAVLAREAPDVASDELRVLGGLLEQYLKSLSAAVAALTAMSKEPQVGRSVSFAAGQVLLYVADEDDLLPEDEVGAIGLLDDTYLAHGCVAAIRAAFPQISVPAEYQPPDERTVAAVRSLLPAGVTDALDRTCDNLVRVAAGLFSGGGETPAAEDRPARPSLRVEAGVGALRDVG
jgi:uncharacterized membrane protein YkvA (DUF1232 family)